MTEWANGRGGGCSEHESNRVIFSLDHFELDAINRWQKALGKQRKLLEILFFPSLRLKRSRVSSKVAKGHDVLIKFPGWAVLQVGL